MASHHITSHAITFICIASHCIALHYIKSHHITFYCIASHHIALHCITSHHFTLHYITSHSIALHCITLRYIALHYITYTLYVKYHVYTIILQWKQGICIIFRCTRPPHWDRITFTLERSCREFPGYGDFLKWRYPNGWMVYKGKIPSRNGWWLGVPPF